MAEFNSAHPPRLASPVVRALLASGTAPIAPTYSPRGKPHDVRTEKPAPFRGMEPAAPGTTVAVNVWESLGNQLQLRVGGLTRTAWTMSNPKTANSRASDGRRVTAWTADLVFRSRSPQVELQVLSLALPRPRRDGPGPHHRFRSRLRWVGRGVSSRGDARTRLRARSRPV